MFDTTVTADYVHVTDRENRVLIIDRTRKGHHIVFFDKNLHGYSGFTTAREFDEYPARARSLNSGGCLVEVGAGLADFVPTLAGKTGNRLIVIDPCQYTIVQRMLEFAHSLPLTEDEHVHADELLRRCSIYLDPTQVHLVNCTLGEALRTQPQLEGCADVVVDFFGAMVYSSSESSGKQAQECRERVRDLEGKLLKPDGKLITLAPSIPTIRTVHLYKAYKRSLTHQEFKL